MKDIFIDMFNGCANMTIIYNSPKIFQAIWAPIKTMIPKVTLERLKWAKKGEEHIIRDTFGAHVVEKRYGGDIPDTIGAFWPPKPCELPKKKDVLNTSIISSL